MYLRCKTVKGHDYVMLVESFRHEGRVKQRVIHNFGRRERIDLAQVRQVLATVPGYAFLGLTSARTDYAAQLARRRANQERLPLTF